MPTTVTIHVFRSGVELVPAMCMYCGQPLEEERFEKFTMNLGHGTRTVELPICRRDRSLAMVVSPDGRSQTLDAIANASVPVPIGGGLVGVGVALAFLTVVVAANVARNLERHQESLQAAFTFKGVRSRFAAELDRLRNLSDKEYDRLMMKANEKFLAQLHGNAPPVVTETDAERAAREAEDVATFGMADATSKSEMSVEVVRANSRKMLLVWVLAGLIAVTLMICMAGGLIGYVLMTRKPAVPPEEIGKKKLPPLKEMKARIKNIDKNQSTIRLLVGDGKYQTFDVTPATEFRDAEDRPLPQGLDAPGMRAGEDVVIFPTEDRLGLQWLKLAK